MNSMLYNFPLATIYWLAVHFYTAIKQSDVDDVRDVLRYYKNHDDPIEAFRENQRKLQVFAHFNSLDMSYIFKPLSSNIFSIIVHVSCHNITNFFNRRHWRQKRNHKKRSKVKAGCFHPVYPPSEDLGDNKCFLL